MYSRMLIPLDGSKTAEKVLPYARHLAASLKLPVNLLAVIDIAEMASHMAAEKARFLDTMVEDGVRNSEGYLRRIEARDGNGRKEGGDEGGAGIGQLVEDQCAAGDLGQDGEQAGAGRGLQDAIGRRDGCGGQRG